MQGITDACKPCKEVFNQMPALCIVNQYLKGGLHVLHLIENFFYFFFTQLILMSLVRKTSTICLSTPHCFALIDSNIGGGVRSDIKPL
jgi:hypothetical protein